MLLLVLLLLIVLPIDAGLLSRSLAKNIALSSASLLMSSTVSAEMMVAPKVELGTGRAPVVRIGTGLYDKEELKAINEKALKTKARFTNMLEQVQQLVDEGKPADAKQVVQSEMSPLKVNMRELSKVASNGDAVIRSADGKASFDYNLGKFNLKPMAEKAEGVSQEINDLYYGSINQGPSAAKKDIEIATKLFDEWDTLVEAALRSFVIEGQ